MSTVPFLNLRVLTLVAGVSCLQLVQDRDGEGNRPLGDVFTPADQEAPAFAAWVRARPGGWNRCHGKPGPVVMLRGLYRFRAVQPGYDPGGNV